MDCKIKMTINWSKLNQKILYNQARNNSNLKFNNHLNNNNSNNSNNNHFHSKNNKIIL